MLYDLSTAVNEELANLNSLRIISEARRYDKEDLRIVKGNEDTTKHWDLLIAASIGFQMKDHAGAIRRKPIKSSTPSPKRGIGIYGT